MKKHVMFLAAATSLALASCSNDHDVELNHGSEICFRTAFEMPHHGGRGAEITTVNDLGDIVVTALDKYGDIYFQNVTFKGNNGSYASDIKYYWPNDGRALKFTAYKADQADIFFDGSGNALTVTPDENWGAHKDLVFCQTDETSKPDNDAGISLNFKHATSQIELRGTNNGVYVVEVCNAKIANVAKNGKLTFTENGLTVDGATTTTYTAGDDFEPVLLTNTAKSLMGATNTEGKILNGNAMVVPQTITNSWNKDNGAYLALKVRIRTDYGANSSWVYPAKTEENKNGQQGFAWVAVALPANTQWMPGMRYVYTLDFTNGAGYTDPEQPDPKLVLDGEIKLSVSMKGWDDATAVNLPGTTTPAAARRK